MKIENQVTNLELSKKLKELGIKQESLFYWGEDHEGARIFSNKTYKDFTAATYKGKEKMFYKALDGGNDIYEDYIVGSAFTVAELFNLVYQIKIDLWIYHNAGKFLVQSHTHNVESDKENLADCLAEILIKTQYE